MNKIRIKVKKPLKETPKKPAEVRGRETKERSKSSVVVAIQLQNQLTGVERISFHTKEYSASNVTIFFFFSIDFRSQF